MKLQDFVDHLQESLYTQDQESPPDNEIIKNINGFSHLLTSDKGLVVSLKDGSQFQIHVVQSEFTDEDSEDIE